MNKNALVQHLYKRSFYITFTSWALNEEIDEV